MKTSAPTILEPTGQALCLQSLRSLLLPGMSCPTRTSHPEIQRQLAQAFQANSLILVPPTDVFASNAPINVACLAKIIAHQTLENGSCISVLRGVARAELTYSHPQENFTQTDMLLTSTYHVQQDFYPHRSAIDRQHRRTELLSLFFRRFPSLSHHDACITLIYNELPLGGLCDLIASSLPLNLSDSLQLLVEQNVDLRSNFVLATLKANYSDSIAIGESLMPHFSDN